MQDTQFGWSLIVLPITCSKGNIEKVVVYTCLEFSLDVLAQLEHEPLNLGAL